MSVRRSSRRSCDATRIVAALWLTATIALPLLPALAPAGVAAEGSEGQCGSGLAPAAATPTAQGAAQATPSVAPAQPAQAGPTRQPGQAALPTATAKPTQPVTASSLEVLRSITRSRYAALRQIDEELLGAAGRLRDAEDQLAQVMDELQVMGERVAAQQVAVDQRTSAYGTRLRALYKFNRFSPLEQLLAARDFGDLLRRAILIQAVVRMDQVLLRQLRAEYAALRAAQEALEAKEREATALRDDIAHEQEVLAIRRSDLAAAAEQAQQEEWQAEAALFQAQESATALAIAALQIQYQRDLDALERQSAAAQPTATAARPAPGSPQRALATPTVPPAGVAGAASASARVASGAPAAVPAGAAPLISLPAPVFTWPVVNPVVTTEFGEPTFAQSAHSGIDLAQRRLAPVLAAADGIVLACGLAVPGDSAQSYGMLVVIAHTRTLATLYAHLEDEVTPPVVTPGQAVKRGQIIGFIGMTGLTTGPHLHFEVRLIGQCQDPRNYLPA